MRSSAPLTLGLVGRFLIVVLLQRIIHEILAIKAGGRDSKHMGVIPNNGPSDAYGILMKLMNDLNEVNILEC